MELLAIENVSFGFPDESVKVLRNIDLRVKEGEFIVLCGASGCGKTTLLRLLKKEIAPVGNRTGTIRYSGKLVEEWDDRKLIEEIGLVSQDPDNQIVMDEVMQEIVFGMENLAYSNFEMRKRMAEMVHFFGMENLLQAKPSELSGGQKQMLNLLSVLLLKPKVLLLDEPTSQLDPIAAKELLLMLERLNKEMGITIILVEHRLEELFAVADRIVMLDAGVIVYEGTSRGLIQSLYVARDERFIPYIPSVSQIYMEFDQAPVPSQIPLNVKETKAWLAKQAGTIIDGQIHELSSGKQQAKLMLAAKDVYFRYGKKDKFILEGFSLEIGQGEFFALVGGNGSGKTTALKACIGSLRPQRGKIIFEGKEIGKLKGLDLARKIAYLPQNPRTYFVQDTIGKEMEDVVRRHEILDGEQRIIDMLTNFGIAHLRDRHPYDCSGGEVQKAALACMLLGDPEMLFIDEPTKGLDPISKQHFADIITDLHQQGLTIMMVTHDIEFAAQNAERCAMMFDGEITVDGTPGQLFKGNYFYTTALNRATRQSMVSEVLTLKEAREIWRNPIVI